LLDEIKERRDDEHVERFENRFKTTGRWTSVPGTRSRSTSGDRGEKERSQIFQGIVTNIRGRRIRQSFTVRKVSARGVERRSRSIPRRCQDRSGAKGKVRRAKLFYLRGRRGNGAKVGEREKLNPETA